MACPVVADGLSRGWNGFGALLNDSNFIGQAPVARCEYRGPA
jgi:hypothetical protein